MSDDETKARDEHLIAALSVALTAGHAINGSATRSVYVIPDMVGGQYAVCVEANGQLASTDTFDDVRAAVAFYLDLCEQP